MVLHQGQYILFVTPRELGAEVWEPRRHGLQEARSRFAADVAYDIAELPSWLQRTPMRHVYSTWDGGQQPGTEHLAMRQTLQTILQALKGFFFLASL